MKECLFGIAVGVLLGALLVESSPQAQEVVEKGKKLVKKSIDKIAKK